MPKGVIDFHYDSGKQYVKKRKRLPGANPDKRPEIKQYNPKDGTASFEGINFVGLVRQTTVATTGWLPWRFMPLSWPAIGTSANERIGNSFFLKSIRFKGYMEIDHNVLRPVRWRLKLFRIERPFPDFKESGSASEQTSAYLSLYKNTEEFAAGLTPTQVINRSRHNYYKAIKGLPKDRPYTSKVIASGVIPINNSFVSKGTFEYGQSNSFHVGTEVSPADWDSGCYPIDVLVKCNDRITWSLNDAESVYQPDIRYCLVLEDDFGVGVLIEPAGYVPGETPTTTIPGVSWVTTTNPCYYLRLTSRAYFTDD